jgi:TRAP-type C4-dicarboxylate transport system permease small subunit
MRAAQRTFEAIAAALLTAVVLIVLIEVVARYVLQISLTWPEELARYTMVWLTFIGAAVGAAQSRSIVSQTLSFFLSPRLKPWLTASTTVLSIVAIAMTLAAMGPMFGPAGMTASSGTGIQTRWVYLALPVGAAGILLFLFRDLVLSVREVHRPGSQSQRSPEQQANENSHRG